MCTERTPNRRAVALDRTKVLETAQKFLAKGQYDKAIVEYQKLVREDPKTSARG